MRDLQLVSLTYRYTDPNLAELARSASLQGVEALAVKTLLEDAGHKVLAVGSKQTDGSWLVEVAP